jgi:hypothetical protein
MFSADGVRPVDAPCVLGWSLGELGFDHAIGFECGDGFAGEFAMGVGVLLGHERGLAGDRVAASLEGGFVAFERNRFRFLTE